MNFFHSIFLGILQGITEFLPISSSGHLVIFQKIFKFGEPPIFFDTIVHLGTAFAIFVFLKNKIFEILKGVIKELKERKIGQYLNLIFFLVLASIPISIVGFLLQDKIDEIFNSLFLLSISFFITAIILFATTLSKKRKKSIKKITLFDSLFVGTFQALAILPGVSRSGSTISAGLFRNLREKDAFDFSFFLGFIAILGASILQLTKINLISKNEISASIIGFLFSFIAGFFALKILKPILEKGKFHYFGYYCLIIGIVCLFLFFKL